MCEGYIYAQSRTAIRKLNPTWESLGWEGEDEKGGSEGEMKGTDGEEAGGQRQEEEEEERRRRGWRAVVLLIVVRRPEVQERTVRPLGALSSLLLLSSSISVLISF